MLKKGPEIKLPPLKVPSFLGDLYQDLRDRHLLPLVALLLVAIVAVPILLGGGSTDEEAGEAAPAEAATPSAAGGEEAGELVAKAAPGLRDYQRRLEQLEAKDPFEQQYRDKQSGAGAGGGGGETSGGGGATTTPASSGGGGGGDTESPSTFPGEGTTTPKLTYYSYAIDVRVTALGRQVGSEPKTTVRRNLPELTMLPGRATPAAIFVGATKDEKKALFVISSDVEAIFGDGKCVLGSQRCEMLMLEPGLPQTFVYGAGGRTFRIELLKIDLVASEKLNKAPLGESKRQKKKGKKGSG